MTTYRVTFDRIGRTHNPEPLTVEARDEGDIAVAVRRHALSMLASRDVEVTAVGGEVFIYAGIQSAGYGTYVELSEADQIEASNQRQNDFFRDNPRVEATE